MLTHRSRTCSSIEPRSSARSACSRRSTSPASSPGARLDSSGPNSNFVNTVVNTDQDCSAGPDGSCGQGGIASRGKTQYTYRRSTRLRSPRQPVDKEVEDDLPREVFDPPAQGSRSADGWSSPVVLIAIGFGVSRTMSPSITVVSKAPSRPAPSSSPNAQFGPSQLVPILLEGRRRRSTASGHGSSWR